MRIRTLALPLAALLAACGGGSQQRAGTNTQSPTPAGATQNRPAGRPDLGVVSSHGGGASNAPAAPAPEGAAPSSAASSADRALVNTQQLDARIKELGAKARQAGASEADKRAAAAAYLERGNVYYSAGQPRLYKYALADFREALRFDPANAEAKDKMAQIEEIYRGMGRPVPSVGADQ